MGVEQSHFERDEEYSSLTSSYVPQEYGISVSLLDSVKHYSVCNSLSGLDRSVVSAHCKLHWLA